MATLPRSLRRRVAESDSVQPRRESILGEDAVGLLLGGLAVEFSRVVLAKLPLHPFKDLLPEMLAAQAPATAQRLEFFLCLPIRLLACLRQRFKQVLAVHIIDENVLPAVPTIHQ